MPLSISRSLKTRTIVVRGRGENHTKRVIETGKGRLPQPSRIGVAGIQEQRRAITHKAQAVLKKMKRRDARKASRLFRALQVRDRVLNEFNQSTLDEVGPVWGEHGTKLLSEMNSLVDDHEDFVKSLSPNVDVL